MIHTRTHTRSRGQWLLIVCGAAITFVSLSLGTVALLTAHWSPAALMGLCTLMVGFMTYVIYDDTRHG